MTVANKSVERTSRPPHATVSVGRALRDIRIITRRNLLRFLRMPQLLIFATVQPVMFLLLFAFVFGGAITLGPVTDTSNYINFLIPGYFVQTVVFGATNTAVGLTEDLNGGVIDRFRSLPMARSAVMGGRTIADMIRSAGVQSLMLVVGVPDRVPGGQLAGPGDRADRGHRLRLRGVMGLRYRRPVGQEPRGLTGCSS